jgi:hypothetical protein
VLEWVLVDVQEEGKSLLVMTLQLSPSECVLPQVASSPAAAGCKQAVASAVVPPVASSPAAAGCKQAVASALVPPDDREQSVHGVNTVAQGSGYAKVCYM